MRTAPLIPAVALAGVLLSGVRTAHSQTSQRSSERQAIESVWLALDSAWNARDAERFSNFFADDVSFEFVDRRQSLDSRAEIHRHFGERFPGFAADVRHRTTVRDIRVFNDNVYVVDGTVDILRQSAGRAEPQLFRTFSITAVMDGTDSTPSIRVLRIYLLHSDTTSQQSPGSA